MSLSPGHSKKQIPLVVILFLFLFVRSTGATTVLNTSSICADVLMVFARGSSANPEASFIDQPFGENFQKKEEVPGAFFSAMQSNLERDYPHVTYKAVSVHNFPNLYSSTGYRAVGIFGPKTINNIFEAELSWWPFGEYRDSVSDGVDETVGFVKDQISLCPDQQIVMGGYSQGANVIGDSLFRFTEQERSRIAAVSLFGDPKYIGSDTNNNTPIDYIANAFQKPKAKSWKRGTATLRDRGSLDARVPYVPADMESRVMSWCFNDDFVCSGGSGVLQVFKGNPLDGFKYDKNDLGAGHSRYTGFGAPQAASEITQRLAPILQQTELSKGGVDPDKTLAQPVPQQPNNTPTDLMFMVNISGGVDDVLGQLRSNSVIVLGGIAWFYGDVMYSVGEYNETGDLPNARVPHTLIRQGLSANLETLIHTMNRKLAFGTLSGGGLDLPDPHMIGIERGVMSGGWRPEATKHLVLITDRPSLTSYTYNMCNSDIRIGFGITDPNYCMSDISLETAPASQQSERCANAYEVLSATNCTLKPKVPIYINNITRTIDDAVRIAQSRGVTVSIVVPHAYRQGGDAVATEAQLKKIALSTGGLFLDYDAFTQANYTDAIWRILNHKPKLMELSMLGSFDTIGAADKLQPGNVATTKTFTPTLLDASGSNTFEEYKWDFDGNGTWDETTDAPSNEHIFSTVSSSTFVSVGGFTDGEQQSQATLPLIVLPGDEPAPLVLPVSPEGITATKNLDGSLEIRWNVPTDPDGLVFFVGDPETRLPIASTPAGDGSIILTDLTGIGDELLVWIDNIEGASDKIVVTIVTDQPASPPTPPNQVVDPEIPVVVDPPEEEPEVVVEEPTDPPVDVTVDPPTEIPPEVVVGDPEVPLPDVLVDEPDPTPTEDDTSVPNDDQQVVDTRPPADKVINVSESNPDFSFVLASTTQEAPLTFQSTSINSNPSQSQNPVIAANFTEVKAADDKAEVTTSIEQEKDGLRDRILPGILVFLTILTLVILIGAYKKYRKHKVRV